MDVSYQIRPLYLLESQVWYLLDIILDMGDVEAKVSAPS